MEKKTISTPVAIAIAVGVLFVVGILGFAYMNHANGPSASPAEIQVQTQKASDAQKQAEDEARQRFANGGGAPLDPAAAAQKQAEDAARANAGAPH